MNLICKARASGSNSPEYKKWANKLGKDFLHTHHLCAALHSLRLSQNTIPTNPKTKEYKRFQAQEVINNTSYLEQHAAPTYILFPLIYTTRAEGLIELNNFSEAIQYLKKAIETNKKYTKSYVVLSMLYTKQENKDLAIKTLQEGIENAPNSKILKKRLQKLQK